MVLYVKDKELVYPGKILAENEGFYTTEGVYKENNKFISKFYGVVDLKNRILKVKPLNKQYLPEEGDIVIGEIKEVMPTSWVVDINSPFFALLFLRDAINEKVNPDDIDLSAIYDVGDLIVGKIIKITRNKTVRISVKNNYIKKLGKEGLVFFVSPARVSDISFNLDSLKKKFNLVDLIVGKNGVIWVKGRTKNDELFFMKNVVHKI